MEEDIHFSCLYFGYASNLSSRTLKQRCPECAHAGLARLDDYKWQVNETGYANIIPSEGDVVYGALAFLSSRDEAALDQSEGVPWLYEKHDVEVTRIDKDGKDLHRANGGTQTVTATTYIDVKRTEDGKIHPEYIIWCNRAIEDAEKEGMPKGYADKYMRRHVPCRKESETDRSTNMIVGSNIPDRRSKHA